MRKRLVRLSLRSLHVLRCARSRSVKTSRTTTNKHTDKVYYVQSVTETEKPRLVSSCPKNLAQDRALSA
eukprot:1359902-Amphidinium_carterae.1